MNVVEVIGRSRRFAGTERGTANLAQDPWGAVHVPQMQKDIDVNAVAVVVVVVVTLSLSSSSTMN